MAEAEAGAKRGKKSADCDDAKKLDNLCDAAARLHAIVFWNPSGLVQTDFCKSKTQVPACAVVSDTCPILIRFPLSRLVRRAVRMVHARTAAWCSDPRRT